MKLEQASYSVDKVIYLKDEYLKHAQFKEETATLRGNILGGILSDNRYSWLARGSKLEILYTKSGSKVAAWCFRAQHDFYTAVTCVVDLTIGNGKAPLLVVGLECEITGGMVCVFDVGSSRVIRAIQIDDKVTSIEVVNGGCDNSLPGVLRALDGVLAVGTAKGKVFLVDLCRQICEEAIGNSGESIKDEINSCHLIPLSFDDLRNLELHKEMSLNKGDHLCLQVNENSTNSEHFSLYGPSDEIRLRANMSEVTVSSLHFSPVLGALLVGYNFGAWQIYSLVSTPLPLLTYTSPMYEDCIPVAYFAVQEPCDDPRAFCYVWVSYSVQDCHVTNSSIAVMYALTYQAKEYLEGYGILYQDLMQCTVRFQLELGSVGPGKNQAAKCLGLRSYTKPTVDVSGERLAVCTLVWTCWDAGSVGGVSEIYLAVFDLNQWYKEQMPAQPRAQIEKYMTCVSLTELMANSGTQLVSADELLDFRLDPQSLSPFLRPQRLEEHYYPSALAFRGLGLFCGQLAWLRSAGSQRQLLAQLESAGPLCLLQPGELYHRCVSLGLCPSHCDVPASPSAPQQRLFVLSVALEHQLVSWLCRCARAWANGAQAASGCTLDMLLDWGWQRANTLKFSADKLCATLFDHTGEQLDHNALAHLNHAACQLKHLTTLFESVLSVCDVDVYYPPQDVEDIRYQLHSLQMITVYLEVLQWLMNVGLLPECPLSMYPRPDECERMSAPYPAESLARFYAERRTEGGALLFVDQLLQHEFAGDVLSKQWQCDGGNGLYPPPSLQALLRTYLLENIDITHKHCLFIYVFLDLAMTLDQSRYKSIITHLIKFPAVFKLSPSIIKMTQAFWQLDHGDFSTAMSQLLDPAVNSEDLKPWHHRSVLKALLLQGQHQHALLYQQVRKPPVSNVQDICIIITLLIVNDLLQEAFHFQRENRSVYNEKEILKHFFSVSEKMNQLPNILHLPLSLSEEDMLVSYLKNIPCETNDTYLVIYYLLRNRYNEAFAVNDDLNVILSQHGVKQGLLGQQDRNFRNVLVSGFRKTLPSVTQLLLDVVKKNKGQKDSWKIVERPQPMSVFIHDTQESAKYKSSLIEASFQKVKEIWAKMDDDTPFISTPKTPNGKRNDSVLIYANVMQPALISSEDLETISEATPAKKMRLSPRQSISCRSQRLSGSNPPSLSLLDTPIVKRKSYRGQTDLGLCQSPTVGTPMSILKMRSLIRNSVSPDVRAGNEDDRGTSTTPEVLDTDLEEEEDQESGIAALSQNISMQSFAVNLLTAQRHRSPLGLSPRRSLQRMPRPAVHFQDATRSSDENNQTSGNKHISVYIDVHREQSPDLPSSKDSDSTQSTEDIYYSPNNSFSSTDNKMTKIDTPSEQIETEACRVSLKRKASDSSVKSRRSYKNTTPAKVEVARTVKTSLPLKDSKKSVESSSAPTNSEISTADEISSSILTSSRGSATSRRSIISSAPSQISSKKYTVSPEISFPGPLVSSRKSIASLTNQKSSPAVLIVPSATLPLQSTPKKSAASSRASVALKKSEVSSKTGTLIPISPRRSTRSKSMEPFSKVSIISSDESPKRKTELFPKLAGRRSLSRQVLEHNTITKALQLPKISLLENIHSQTTDVEVSYSVTEETCDERTVESKNDFTCETEVIKHVHNESSFKSSVTEILDDSNYHVLSFDSYIETSEEENIEENERVEEMQHKEQEQNEQQIKISQEKEEEEIIIEKNMNVSMEEENMDVSVEEENKKSVSNESIFEDISSIIETEESDSEEAMDTNASISISKIDRQLVNEEKQAKKENNKDIREDKDHDKDTQEDNEQKGKAIPEDSEHSSENSTDDPEIIAVEEDSSEDTKPLPEEDRQSSEYSDDSKHSEEIVACEDNKHSPQSSEGEEKISTHYENSNENSESAHQENNVDEVDEEVQNILVCSEDDTNEEKISNQENKEYEEEKSEEEEEQSAEENSAAEETDNESRSYISSRSSDVIEINSSSSVEAITLNQSEDPEENVSYDEENVLEQNITTVEEVIEEVDPLQQAEKRKDDIIEDKVREDIQQVENELQQMEEEIQKMEEIQAVAMKKDAAELAKLQELQEFQKGIVPEIEQEVDQNVQHETEQEGGQDIQHEIEQEVAEEITQKEAQECVKHPENISLEIEEIITEEEKSKVVKEDTASSADSSKENTSQDCLETMKFHQSQLEEDLEQTDILCNNSFAKETKVEALVENYIPSRRSKRINSKQQETKEDVIATRTRRRSMSIDPEKSPPNESDRLKKPTRSTSSVSTEPLQEEETFKPLRSSTRRRSNSVNSEIIQEETTKPTRSSTRQRSTRLASAEEEAPRATRATRSASVDVENTKPYTRNRSTSVDAEEVHSSHTTRRITRASSVINLPIISEVSSKTPAKRGRKRSIQSDTIDEELEIVPEKIEDYSATHRLTRRQKMIMEKSLEIQERKKLEIAEFDPIKLLDKKDFTGTPDLEERQYRGNSPASSIDTQSSVATRLTPEGTPKKTSTRRTSQGTPDTPRRSSRHSRDTFDDVSSIKSVPVVQLDRGDILRHRSLSPTALKDSISSPRSTRKSVRSSVLPKKIELSKISEENDTKSSQQSAAQDKELLERDPSKITEKMDVEESQSFATSKASSTKRRTYKPLEESAPRYSAYKSRKSFKVKKPTRGTQ